MTAPATHAPPAPTHAVPPAPQATPSTRAQRSRPRGQERGQGTVEYALLLLGAAAIALVVVAWVTRTDLIGRLFDTVIGRILSQA